MGSDTLELESERYETSTGPLAPRIERGDAKAFRTPVNGGRSSPGCPLLTEAGPVGGRGLSRDVCVEEGF